MQANAWPGPQTSRICPWCQMITCRTLVYENSLTMHQIYIPNCVILQRHIKLAKEYEAYRINRARNANLTHIEEAQRQWKELRQNFPNEIAKTYQSWKDHLARSQVPAQEGERIRAMMGRLEMMGYRGSSDSDTPSMKRLKNQKVVKPTEGEDSSNAHRHDQASHQRAAEVRKHLYCPTHKDLAVRRWLKESAMRLFTAIPTERDDEGHATGRWLVEVSPGATLLSVRKKNSPKIINEIIAIVQNEELVFTELGQRLVPQVPRETEERLFSEYMKRRDWPGISRHLLVL